MTEFRLTPRLDALPVELLKIIFKDPTSQVELQLDGCADSLPGWMPFESRDIAQDRDAYSDYTASIDGQPFRMADSTDTVYSVGVPQIEDEVQPVEPEPAQHEPTEEEDLHTTEHAEHRDSVSIQWYEDLKIWTKDARSLQAISRTCRSLRAFALPILWTIAQVRTVEELRRLLQSLDVMPHLGSYLRHFAFEWVLSSPTGREKPHQDIDSFNDHVTAIMKHATSLRSLRWKCTVASLPATAVAVLKRNASLDTLAIDMRYERRIKTLAPLWELAPSLVQLSFGPPMSNHHRNAQPLSTRSEEDIASFQLPSLLGKRSQVKKIQRVAWRLIVAAVRTGKLRRLFLNEGIGMSLCQLFPIRTLLPCWIGINDWGYTQDLLCLFSPDKDLRPTQAWLAAALWIRPALAHTAHAASKRADPLVDTSTRLFLTGADVQSMRAEFSRVDLPVLFAHDSPSYPGCEGARGGKLVRGTPIDQYLSWLAEEAVLSQLVAEAWNNVVKRGDAHLHKCWCELCDVE